LRQSSAALEFAVKGSNPLSFKSQRHATVFDQDQNSLELCSNLDSPFSERRAIEIMRNAYCSGAQESLAMLS